MAKVLAWLSLLAVLALAEKEDVFKVRSFAELKLKGTVRQTYEESCGAGALATLINMYGKQIGEQEVLVKASKTDMLSFAEMAKIAQEFGFEASGYKLSIGAFSKLVAPVIARIDNRDGYSHFVVAVNHDGDFVSIYDPSFGYYIENKQEFFRWWSEDSKGMILIAMPEHADSVPKMDLQLPNRNLFLR